MICTTELIIIVFWGGFFVVFVFSFKKALIYKHWSVLVLATEGKINLSLMYFMGSVLVLMRGNEHEVHLLAPAIGCFIS